MKTWQVFFVGVDRPHGTTITDFQTSHMQAIEDEGWTIHTILNALTGGRSVNAEIRVYCYKETP